MAKNVIGTKLENEESQMSKEIKENHPTSNGAVMVAVGAALVASGAALVAVALTVFLVLHTVSPRPSSSSLDFDSIVQIPPNAPEDGPEGEDGMPSRGQFALARVDAWVLTHNLFADLRAGKITREEAIAKLRHMVRMAHEDDEFELFDAKAVGVDCYMQMGEMKPLICLLQTAISNLSTKVEKRD